MNTCIRPGCNKPKYPGHNFCGKTCASQPIVQTTCIRPGCNKPKHAPHDFCGKTCAASGQTHQTHQTHHSHVGKVFSGTIDFYNTRDARTGYLTNLASSPFTDTGFLDLHIPATNLVFPTAEHYFQCMKYALMVVGGRVVMRPLNQWIQHYNALIKLSGRAIQMYDKLSNGSSNPAMVQQQIGAMWHTSIKQLPALTHSSRRVGNASDYTNLSLKDWVMLNALKMKFKQNPQLLQRLKQTSGNLYEHTTNDSYWGDGGSHHKGKNMLGALLMYVRYIL